MPPRGETPDTQDLLTRLYAAEGEIKRLREFRHNYSTDRMVVLLKIEQFEARLAQVRADITEGRGDHGQLSRDVAALNEDLDQHQRTFGLKTAEYDKERDFISSIAKPLLIALLLAIGGGLLALLFKLYTMFGTK